jgi:large subunit ribosomal protein L4
MYRGAVRSILSELARQERLVVVPEIAIAAPKTKELVAFLKGLDLSDCLILTDGRDEQVFLASRNLPGVDVLSVQEVDPVSLIAFETLVLTPGAVKKLEERLA